MEPPNQLVGEDPKLGLQLRKCAYNKLRTRGFSNEDFSGLIEVV